MDYGVGAYKTLYTNNTDEAQTVMYELSVSSSELYYTWMWLSDTPSSIASDASSTGMRPKVYHGSSYSETLTLPAGWCIGFGEYYCNGTVKLYVWK